MHVLVAHSEHVTYMSALCIVLVATVLLSGDRHVQQKCLYSLVTMTNAVA